jgi:hypothetical protein
MCHVCCVTLSASIFVLRFFVGVGCFLKRACPSSVWRDCAESAMPVSRQSDSTAVSRFVQPCAKIV